MTTFCVHWTLGSNPMVPLWHQNVMSLRNVTSSLVLHWFCYLQQFEWHGDSAVGFNRYWAFEGCSNVLMFQLSLSCYLIFKWINFLNCLLETASYLWGRHEVYAHFTFSEPYVLRLHGVCCSFLICLSRSNPFAIYPFLLLYILLLSLAAQY